MITRENWAKAVDALKQAQAYAADLPTQAKRALLGPADLLLAACYQKLGDAEQQLAAYRRILDVDGDRESPPRRGPALLASGKTDEALAAYRGLLPDEPAVALEVARLRLAENRRLPRGAAQPGRRRQALAAAEQADPDSIGLALLRAEALADAGKPATGAFFFFFCCRHA